LFIAHYALIIDMKASVILPTYNERDNIVELIAAICTVLTPCTDFEIVVVDDR